MSPTSTVDALGLQALQEWLKVISTIGQYFSRHRTGFWYVKALTIEIVYGSGLLSSRTTNLADFLVDVDKHCGTDLSAR